MKRNSPYTLAYAGVLIAMNLILSRLVSIPVGSALRISAGSVPIMLSGLWLGPVTGGLCGLVGDLIGCFISGYAPNPLLSCSAVLTGVIPGLAAGFIRKEQGLQGRFLRMLAVTGGMMLITSQGLSTLGIALMAGTSFGAMWLTRLPQTLLLLPVNAFLASVFYDRIPLPMPDSGKTKEKDA